MFSGGVVADSDGKMGGRAGTFPSVSRGFRGVEGTYVTTSGVILPRLGFTDSRSKSVISPVKPMRRMLKSWLAAVRHP